MKKTTMLLVVLAGLASTPSHACVCVPNFEVPEPKLVFLGIATRKELVYENIVADGQARRMIRYTFKVKIGHPVASGEDIFIYSDDSDCAAQFLPGKTYRVTAKQFPEFGERWYTGDCWGNVRVRVTFRSMPTSTPAPATAPARPSAA
jgi:hypothetical protein